MNNFTAHTDEIRKEMLKETGVSNIDELFAEIPNEARMSALNLGSAKSEMAVQNEIKKLAKMNNTDLISFIGAGSYNKFIPACISSITSRFEFNTAYTPYQPEISQGTLQSIYEFQSMICSLTGMDVSNASVYDGGTACAEALFMATRITRRNKVLVSSSVNPQFKEVIKTYCWANNVEVEFIDVNNYATDYNLLLEKTSSNDIAGVLLQSPNFYGTLEELENINKISDEKVVKILCVEPSTLTILKSPVEYGFDIVVGDIQTLGIPQSFGGAYAGFIACLDKYKRQLSGRIVGKTLDKEGKVAYTLTLQTREQHIRREKATSNICSNQALVALASTIYMSVMGENGIKQAVLMSVNNAKILSENLKNLGYKIKNTDFLYEFVLEVDNADRFLSEFRKNLIVAGLKLSDNEILVSTTEMTLKEDIDKYLEVAKSLLCFAS